MKTLNLPLSARLVSRKPITLPKISFWIPLTRCLNHLLDEKYTVDDVKKIVHVTLLLLLLGNIYLWPCALFPIIYLLKGIRK